MHVRCPHCRNIVLVLVAVLSTVAQATDFHAKVIRIVDGDTVDLEIDLGCYSYIKRRCRLLGFDTPEVVGADRAAGLAASRRLSWVACVEKSSASIEVDTSTSKTMSTASVRMMLSWSPF